jgi:hypothetical protein
MLDGGRHTICAFTRRGLGFEGRRAFMRERQLELRLGNGKECRSVNLRGRRHRRRHEWFERMRLAVNAAPDAKPQEEDRALSR